ncbi:MAG: oxidoreductase [Verrucomicrobiota bacterium]
MAVLWSNVVDGNHYEVRSAGATLRLYRNGVNHSQWNPIRPLAGSIWDLIVLPALQRPQGSLHDALILGFGAGTVGRQLRDIVGIERIVGLEMDPMHLSIADGFFDCSEGCELIAGDAVEWVYEEGIEGTYDLVIDDLYAEEDGIPVRSAPLDTDWCRKLAALLRPGGLLVFNLIEPDKVSSIPPVRDSQLNERFPFKVVYHIDGYENRVLALSDAPFAAKELDAALKQTCQRFPRCYGVAKRYLSYVPQSFG